MATHFSELLAGLPAQEVEFIRQECTKALAIKNSSGTPDRWEQELRSVEASRKLAEKVLTESVGKRNKLIKLLGRNSQMSAEKIAGIVDMKPRRVRAIING